MFSQQKMPPGLELFENYISEERESWLLSELSKCFGIKMELEHKTATYFGVFQSGWQEEETSEKLIAFCQDLAKRFKAEDLTEKDLNECFVHSFSPGAGFKPHIDPSIFQGEAIIILNCGSGVTIDFEAKEEKLEVYYPPRALVVMRGAARYEYSHGMAYRDYDFVKGVKTLRKERFGMTWMHKEDLTYEQRISRLPPDILKAVMSDPKIIELQEQLRQSEHELEKSKQKLEESKRRLKNK